MKRRAEILKVALNIMTLFITIGVCACAFAFEVEPAVIEGRPGEQVSIIIKEDFEIGTVKAFAVPKDISIYIGLETLDSSADLLIPLPVIDIHPLAAERKEKIEKGKEESSMIIVLGLIEDINKILLLVEESNPEAEAPAVEIQQPSLVAANDTEPLGINFASQNLQQEPAVQPARHLIEIPTEIVAAKAGEANAEELDKEVARMRYAVSVLGDREIAALQEKVFQAEMEVEMAQSNLAQAQAELARGPVAQEALQSEGPAVDTSELERNLEKKKEDLPKALAKMADSQSAVSALEGKQQQQQQEISKAQTEFDEAKEGLDKAQAGLDKLQQEQQEAGYQDKLAKAQEELEGQQLKLAEAEERVSQLEDNLNKETDESAKYQIQDELYQAETQRDLLKVDRDQAQTKLDRSQTLLMSAQDEMTRLQVKLQQAQAEFDLRQAGLESAKEKSAELGMQVEEAKAGYSQAEAEVMQLEAEIEQMQLELDAAKQQPAAVSPELAVSEEDLQMRVEQATMELDAAKMNLEQLQQELAQLTADLSLNETEQTSENIGGEETWTPDTIPTE